MTQGKDIINFVKNQPLFDVHRQHLWTFLIDLQAEVSKFGCRIFHCFAYFSRLSSVFIFYKLSAGQIVLHLESCENNRFELDF